MVEKIETQNRSFNLESLAQRYAEWLRHSGKPIDHVLEGLTTRELLVLRAAKPGFGTIDNFPKRMTDEELAETPIPPEDAGTLDQISKSTYGFQIKKLVNGRAELANLYYNLAERTRQIIKNSQNGIRSH